MKKERTAVASNAILVFDRNVNVSELNKLAKDFYGDVVILGQLFVDEPLRIKCNLHVMQYIICNPEQSFKVEGDLYCYSEMAIYNICVDGCLYCEGAMCSNNIIVGESLYCKNKIEAYGGKITVMGDFECHGIKADTVEAYGETYMEGPIFVRKLIKSGR